LTRCGRQCDLRDKSRNGDVERRAGATVAAGRTATSGCHPRLYGLLDIYLQSR